MNRDELRSGDVVRYNPLPQFEGQRDVHWCREGMAVTGTRDDGSLYLADTFWGSGGDRHLLTAAEIESARVIFNVNDYDELPRYEFHSSQAAWEKYASVDRELITSQHRLERRWFIRKGASEDWDTKIQNARRELIDAEYKLHSAEHDVRWRASQLADVEAAASGASVSSAGGVT